MKTCTFCGASLDDSVTFCTECGTRLEEATNVQPAAAEQPVAEESVAPVQPVAVPVQADMGYQPQPQMPVQQNGYAPYQGQQVVYNPAPVTQLKTNRGLLKTILLSGLTFGIYGLVAFSSVSTDINIIASRYDGRKTMHYCLLLFVMMPLTLGIASIVWFHNISNRMGNELKRRGINYAMSAGSYWGWCVLGSFIVIGPFVYLHKFFKAMNLLSENFNQFG